MELKVNNYELPEVIKFNYDELKQELASKVEIYKTLVYTDDTIQQAKTDRATLNKLKKALNDERIRREKEYLQPFSDFKNKINEIIKIIDEPVCIIDKRIKETEEAKKEEKREKIQEIFNALDFNSSVTLEKIFNSKWLNTSVSIKSIEDDLKSEKERIDTDIDALSKLQEFSFEAIEVYKQTLNLNSALVEGQRLANIQKRKEIAQQQALLQEQQEEQQQKVEEQQASKQQPASEETSEKKVWVEFKAFLTHTQAKELKAFCETNNIELEAI